MPDGVGAILLLLLAGPLVAQDDGAPHLAGYPRTSAVQDEGAPPALAAHALAGTLVAQDEGPPTLAAHPLTSPVRVDGHLTEAAWASADSVDGLVEVEPEEGGRPAGRTVVRVLANPSELVIGIRADDPDPAGIVSYAIARDARLDNEDHIRLVLDTFLDGRSGYVFAVNPKGARYDALVANQGEGENADWDGIWEAAAARTADGWSAEIRIPVRSLAFGAGLDTWGFNVERRVQRLLETSRWASPSRDYRVTQTSRAGRLTGLPRFSLGVGVSVTPSVVGGLDRPDPGTDTDLTGDGSLDVTQRIGGNVLASLTVNTDFAETEVDTRQTNLTRFPVFFPEKRAFFLEGADIFDFGLGLGGGRRTEFLPFFSRRIGLLEGEEVPLRVGGKVNGRLGQTSFGALAVRTGEVTGLTPGADVGVVRVRQNVLRESHVGVLGTFGDPTGAGDAWTAGADFTYQTSGFLGDRNFLAGVWALAAGTQGRAGDGTAVGFKVDYPNDLWDIAVTYRRVGDAFQPALGFVPRPGVHAAFVGINYTPRPDWPWLRQAVHQLRLDGVADLDGEWESYSVFTAPINWRLESGDRAELNWVPEGERLTEPFEVADGVVLPAGEYHFTRWRLEWQFASKRRLSGQATWWFGSFYTGTLDQIQLRADWNPGPILTLGVDAERNIGRLPEGDFTVDLVGVRGQLNLSPDLLVASLVQYDNESASLGSNTRLRWTFHPAGDLFVVYNHNVRDTLDRWAFESNQLLVKLRYTWRY